MSNKYSATLVFSASTFVEVTADTPEEAAEAAYNTDEASSVRLCHQCAHEIDIGDCYRVIVHDENDNEVFGDGFQEQWLKKVTSQRDELLAALEEILEFDISLADEHWKKYRNIIAHAKGGA